MMSPVSNVLGRVIVDQHSYPVPGGLGLGSHSEHPVVLHNTNIHAFKSIYDIMQCSNKIV